MAIDDYEIYVVKSTVGQVGKYDAITGAAVNGSLITGLQNPYGAVVSGSNLFVTSVYPNSIIGEYTTSGATVNAQLVTGLARPSGVALAPDDAIPAPGTAALA